MAGASILTSNSTRVHTGNGANVSMVDWDAVWRSLDWNRDQSQDVEQALIRRAERYARPTDDNQQRDQETLELLIFWRGQERYALPVEYVIQGAVLPRITPLPCVPSFYCGVMNLRGRILSVLDIRRFWGLPETTSPAFPNLIVIRAGQYEIALLADDIEGLDVLPLADQVAPAAAGIGLAHVQGVSPDGIVILDIESLLADSRLTVHEDM